MRILRINILNLNSLRGEHLIDFTVSPLADHSLYAIVGPTGAGKTTILDAITLALYGQTERNKTEVDRKDGTGSVLSYGEGECRAELEYETAAGRFLSSWTRQRAHKKTDGNLTSSRHSISRFNPKTDAWDILATKKREVAEKTEEVVGLDYERFVRSVMLTQGDFARFLKSDAGNKAEILEKITGTEIYRDLSVAAYNRAKMAREAHEAALQDLTTAAPLDAASRARLDEQLTSEQANNNQLKKDLAEANRQLALYEQLALLHGKTVAAKTELDRLDAAWQSMAADRDRLAASEALEPLRADLEAEVRLTTEIQRLEASVAAAGEAGRAIESRAKEAKAAIIRVQQKLNDYYEKLPGREQKFAVVAGLENEVRNLRRDIDLDEKRRDSIARSLAERATKGRELRAGISQLNAELAGLTPEEIRQQLVALEESLPELRTELESLEQRMVRRKTADRLATESAAVERITLESGAAAAALTAAEATLRDAELARSDRQLTLQNLLVSASLSEHKNNLQPGEACPVCGATEHPALEGFVPVTETAIARSTEDVQLAGQRVAAATQAVKAARQTEATLRQQLDAHTTIIKELTAQLAGVGEPEKEPLPALQARRDAAGQRLVTGQERQTRLRRLEAHLPRLLTLETELAGHASRHAELTAELKTVETTLAAYAAELAAKTETIFKEIGDRTVEQCRELTRKKKDDLLAQLARAEKTEADEKEKLAATQARLKALEEQRNISSDALATTQERLRAELSGLAVDSATARARLLPPAQAAELRQRLDRVTSALATARTVSQRLAEEVLAAEKAVSSLPAKELLDKARAEGDFRISESDRLIGAVTLQIQQDEERIARTTEKITRLEGLRKESDRWATMSKLIGSADGKKFRSYAQAITLQRLIDTGNGHLRSISPRYRMEYLPPAGGGENLEMIIVDTYHDDNRRTMATLSGGETFLISLALALGLSDLASGKNLIQSLFIDEGFGTLDGKTLDQAMTTLEQLRAQGKMIGLISHVPSLRERIQCQVQLEPVGDGFSRIVVVG